KAGERRTVKRARSAERSNLAPAHESLHAAARRTKDGGLHEVWLARLNHHGRSVRRGWRKVSPGGFRLDGARVSVRGLGGQDFRDASSGLRKFSVFSDQF